MTPDFAALWRVFGRIGLLSFGGPAAQIALMHRELVENRPWLTEKQFLSALSFCMLLPGPEAMQLATYAGWRLRGTWGGILAGLLFVLPGALIILALALLYVQFGDVPLVQQGFLGVKAAVVALIMVALWRLSKKALKSAQSLALAALSFVAIYVLQLPFPLIILTAAALGALILPHAEVSDTGPLPNGRHALRQTALWGTLWVLPILLVLPLADPFLKDLALFFSKLAIVTFGGAYAVLAYMTQEVSVNYGWISTPQMMDALGLAETTPGPLILVTEFVGLIAGEARGGLPLMLTAGALTLWCTFVPCFLWIFVAAPYVDWLQTRPRLASAMQGISAAVVGVILNLALWFALHVLFDVQVMTGLGLLPVWHSLNGLATGIAALALAFMILTRLPFPAILMIAAGLSIFAL